MTGRTAVPPLTRLEAIYAADNSDRALTVYAYKGKYHMISSQLEKHIPIDAVIVHKAKPEDPKTFRYNEGGKYVREEVVDEKGTILSRRSVRKLKSKVEVGNRRETRVYKKHHG